METIKYLQPLRHLETAGVTNRRDPSGESAAEVLLIGRKLAH